MKFALQTISWGPSIPPAEEFTTRIKQLGFDGIEIAQPVTRLGSPHDLQDALNCSGLRCAGLAGGSLPQRIDCGLLLGVDYLYCDEWRETDVESAVAAGLTVALHPHLYKDLERVSDADRYIQQYSHIRLIVDTAHSFLAGDDVLAAIETHIDSLAAIHMKDWTGRFGRSPYRFSMGFTALGRGELSSLLEDVIDWVVQRNYNGWIVIEQDNPDGDPFECAAESLRWIQGRMEKSARQLQKRLERGGTA